MRRSGISALVIWLVSACHYGFAGGGLPSNIRTVAVLPFENETSSPTVQRTLYDALRREVQNRLGLHAATENRADAVVRGRILRYDTDIPESYSADRQLSNVARRKLQITVDVEIVDQKEGRTLWTRKGMLAEGAYGERNEAEGRRIAVEKLVSDVIAGAQSQW